MTLRLGGRTALVVGGSSGIGLGIARRLQAADVTVHITGTREAARYGDDIDGLSYHRLDVVDGAAVADLASRLESLNVLVYSAGIVAYRRAEYDIATFRNVVEVNLVGAMSCCSAFHRSLAATDEAAVLLIGSTSSFIATPGQPAYGASKGALVTLVKSLAKAWARDGIRVNGLAPGLVETKLTSASRDNPAAYAASLERIPLGRWGTTEEMGDAAAFLVSPLASYITGQMLLADGGATLL
ncbi:SDR family NAD(P)-dependent oxidoreductase [Sporichthya polymorpha]|uniref:SDR family NAD(P)-dependent oxidoreductase n=1 Tax=Sporichthya polymorpha TaxID=35751 RepID=UPI00048E7145|nr:SDR family oxidoreductase [Sporichthya polymorpha]